MSVDTETSDGDQFTPADFELIYSISENNAGRSCATCREDAWVYLFIDGTISTFRCPEHTPAAVRDYLNEQTENLE